jgi:dihydrofolate reductase
MGKVVITEFVSVDGVFEDPGGSEDFEHGGWSFEFKRGDDGDKFKLDETLGSDALLLGRVTYEGFADAWPKRSGDPFSEKFNSMPKYVVSSTLKNPEWNNSTVIGGDLSEEVSKLKQEHEKDIVVHGSGQLARGLLDQDLVDEVRLMVFPVVLGKGKRPFDGTDMQALTLVDSKPVGPDGVIVLTYGRRE